MEYYKCTHTKIVEFIDKSMEELCAEASTIRKEIVGSHGVYEYQIKRLIQIGQELEDYAIIFDQASRQVKRLSREMKEFNENVVKEIGKAVENVTKKQ